MAADGARLTDAERDEYLAYTNQNLTPPERFDGIVYDNSYGPTQGYRWPTADEKAAARAAAKAGEDARKANDALYAKARDEAARRSVKAPPPIPAKPE